MSNFPDFTSRLKKKPDETLSAAGIAMHKIVNLRASNSLTLLETLHACVINYEPVSTIASTVVYENLDTLVSVRGTVMRLSDVKYWDLWVEFKCLDCGETQLVYQNNGKRVMPKSCKKKGCRNRSKFQDIYDSPYLVLVPVQHIRLQENMFADANNTLKSLDVIIKYENVETLEAGDDIVVTGVLRVSKGGTDYKEYIDGVSITNRNTGFTPYRMDLKNKDLEAIEAIRTVPSVLRLLVNSLKPELHDLEMVKAGLILSLFSGSPAADDEKDQVQRRENIHVLLVGDPGVGKSELLNACCKVAPKAIYSISTHLTGAGLSGSLRCAKGVHTLNAGALTLAHGGICCIDEIDKRPKITNELLDAMEMQQISILKMGTTENLSCRTTILASGNPAGSIYNKSKSVAENIKLNPALLTRFDLIFIMIKQNQAYPGEKRSNRFEQHTIPLTQKAESLFGKREFSLENFLRLDHDEEIRPLPAVLYQNYIAFARTHVFPKMTRTACEELLEFYMELQRKQEILDFFEITTRQFQALRRLCIARARVDLEDEVTIEHVRDVIELTRYSLIDIFTTENGELESRGEQSSGMSKPKQKLALLENMKKFYNEKEQKLFNMDQIKKMVQYLRLTENAYDLVDSLNIQGYLLLRGSNIYELIP